VSLSEKLQLVETSGMTSRLRPKQCPCTTGKKKNWQGENRICLAIQAQRSPGKKFSAEFAVCMAVDLNCVPTAFQRFLWRFVAAYRLTEDHSLSAKVWRLPSSVMKNRLSTLRPINTSPRTVAMQRTDATGKPSIVIRT
jgi:hypothetical protein